MNIYEDIEYLSQRWNYSELEILYQELNNLTHRHTCRSTYHSGLIFKRIGDYSTLAGMMSGQAGWCMTLCWDDYRITVADRLPETVIKKAIYWFAKMKTKSPTDRKITESFMAGDEWKNDENQEKCFE